MTAGPFTSEHARAHIPARLGPFVVLRVVGCGGSGIVYAATRDGDMASEPVAIKVLRDDLALSDRERRRFLDEAERMRRFTHPGIVGVIDAGTLPDGRPFIVMPLLHGETLARRIARGPLPLDEALAQFEMLADAVAALHATGLVHRDIKPENVLVEERQKRPVLLDFGIARDVSDGASTTTEAGKVRGTPAYMAPERFFGVQASVATDVYELAVVLYMMLVGRLPWSDESGAAARLHPDHPEDAGIALPRAITLVVLRALSTRPEARPNGARELLAQLAEARGAEAVALPDPRATSSDRSRLATDASSAFPPPVRPRRRVRRIVVAASVALLTAGAGWGASRTSLRHAPGRETAPAPAAAPSPRASEPIGVSSDPPAESPRPAALDTSTPTSTAPLAAHPVRGRPPAQGRASALAPVPAAPPSVAQASSAANDQLYRDRK
jgi:serine/threonine-protein kinase